MTKALEEIDSVLLLVSEARERAESVARSVVDEAEPHLVKALEEADRSLLAVHGDLMRAVYFPGSSSEEQLKLAESA